MRERLIHGKNKYDKIYYDMLALEYFKKEKSYVNFSKETTPLFFSGPNIHTHAGRYKDISPHYKKLVGEKVYLSPVSTDDWQLFDKWHNDYELTFLLHGGRSDVSPPATGSESLEKRAKDKNAFTIGDKETDIAIGTCEFNYEDSANRNAKIGIKIGEREFWSRGYGGDAIRLMLDFGFNVRSYNSICLNVYEYNKRGIACYEKVGFKRQGVWRETLQRGEIRYDGFYYDILASEYFMEESK
jgi:RimJ/RimL family protein N-acetyltransferase